MKTFILLLLTYAAAVLAAGRGSWTSFGAWEPAWLPLMLAVVLVGTKGRATLLWAAALGLLDDSLAYGVLGIGLLVYTLTAIFAQPLLRFSLRMPTLLLPVAVFAIAVQLQFCAPLLRDLLQSRDALWTKLLFDGVYSAISSAALCLNLTSLLWTINRLFRTTHRDVATARLNLWRLLPE